MTIAVSGATGHLGRLIIAQLKSRLPADRIVALARSPQKAADLGVAVRHADYDRPETLNEALSGIDTLMFVSASEIGKRVAQHQNLIDAAKAAGVGHIVYTSILRADTSTISLAEEHRATEAAIRASGIAFTFLRNGWYTENYVGSVQSALAHGALVGSAGNGRISAAARVDYADAAVAVLTGAAKPDTIYELAGDTAFTLSDLAEQISSAAGKNIPYRDVPTAEYARILAGAGLPEALAQTIASWDVAVREGALFDDSHTLSRLIGHATTPITGIVAEAVKAAA